LFGHVSFPPRLPNDRLCLDRRGGDDLESEGFEVASI
jgi:hypothetical protein